MPDQPSIFCPSSRMAVARGGFTRATRRSMLLPGSSDRFEWPVRVVPFSDTRFQSAGGALARRREISVAEAEGQLKSFAGCLRCCLMGGHLPRAALPDRDRHCRIAKPTVGGSSTQGRLESPSAANGRFRLSMGTPTRFPDNPVHHHSRLSNVSSFRILTRLELSALQ